MGELGAKPFYDCTDADEVDGLEEAIERWVGGLWAPLRQALAAKTNSPQVLGFRPDKVPSSDASVRSKATP